MNADGTISHLAFSPMAYLDAGDSQTGLPSAMMAATVLPAPEPALRAFILWRTYCPAGKMLLFSRHAVGVRKRHPSVSTLSKESNQICNQPCFP